MFDISFFTKGWLIGFSVAAAVGPIAILCIQRSIARGFKAGFSVGLGAALADSVYSAIAGAGLVGFADFLLRYTNYISFAGGVFLIWLGIKTFMSRADCMMMQDFAVKPRDDGYLARIFLSSFFLTISSPMTILMFTAIFSSVGIINLTGGNTLSLILGVFIGSTCWWLILSGGVGIVREKISVKLLAIINRASAGMILFFACFAIFKTI